MDDSVVKIRFNLNQNTASIEALGNESTQKNTDETLLENIRIDSQETVKLEHDLTYQTIKAFWIKDQFPPYYFVNKEETLLEKTQIRNFEFYPGRLDAIIAAYDNLISVIEIDSRQRRIVQNIYKGREPNFGIISQKDIIYILDAGNLIELNLTVE